MRLLTSASVACGAAFLVLSPLSAQEETGAEVADTVAEETASEDEIIVDGEIVEDRVVCKRIKPPTASRISRSKKVCKKNSVWQAEKAAADQLTSDYLRDDFNRAARQNSQTMNNSRTTPPR